MILVDTSVWIAHLHTGDRRLAGLLEQGQCLTHPFVTGELACGNLHNRQEILALLGNLPQSPVASAAEVLHFIENHRLMGRGIGYIDVHLLAAVTLAENALLWTVDKRLQKVAEELDLAFWLFLPEERRTGVCPLFRNARAI